MSDSNVFSPDFREFVELLNQNEVEYLITGGYAVGIYGHPRYTGDLDVWVNPTKENGDRLVSVFNAFGLSSFGLTSIQFTYPEQVIQIGYPPFRIDILTSIDGVDFPSAFLKKEIFVIDNIPIAFISLSDLKKNKLASGRRKDLDDLENLSTIT